MALHQRFLNSVSLQSEISGNTSEQLLDTVKYGGDTENSPGGGKKLPLQRGLVPAFTEIKTLLQHFFHQFNFHQIGTAAQGQQIGGISEAVKTAFKAGGGAALQLPAFTVDKAEGHRRRLPWNILLPDQSVCA